MNAAEQVVNALEIFFALLSLWFLAFWLFRDYRVDALRQRLFNLRHDLFDYARNGNIAFDDPAYGTLRSRINTVIRFAHRFTSMQLLFVSLLGSPVVPEPYVEWKKQVEKVPSENVRKKLYEFNARMVLIMVSHLVSGSPLLVGALIIFSIGMVIRGSFQAITERFAQWVGVGLLEAQATEAEAENLCPAS